LVFLAAPVIYGAAVSAGDPLAAGMTLLVLLWIGSTTLTLVRTGKSAIPRTVVRLIAGISLVDALFAAAWGAPGVAALAVVAFGLTLALQRWVAGT
jgi:4-hydroxybenzoate polyprenyltransferase